MDNTSFSDEHQEVTTNMLLDHICSHADEYPKLYAHLFPYIEMVNSENTPEEDK